MKKNSKRPTLSEVAARAGVGTTTVSRVINGGQRVDPKTLARVRQVIDTLGYTPNQAARILKGHRTRTIGLLIPSIADPFFASCAEAAQAIARAHGSVLIVATTQNDPRTELENVDVMISHRADGLIVAPADSEGTALRKALDRAGVPVVTLDRPLCGSSIPAVLADNFAGAQMAARHLIEHGYKRILCMTGEPHLYTIGERMRGYRAAVEAEKLPVLMDTSIHDYESAENAIRNMLDGENRPDAIFTLKNSTTMFAFEALQKLNVAIPGSVSLVGYDDFELAAAVRPSITVIQQPIAEMGRTAAEILFRELPKHHKNGRPARSTRAEHVQLETRLIRRSSCGCTAGAQ